MTTEQLLGRLQPGTVLTPADCAALKACLRPAEVVVYVSGGCVQGARSTVPGIPIEVWDMDSPEDLRENWRLSDDVDLGNAYREIIEAAYPHAIL
jgi:hypothetical protein